MEIIDLIVRTIKGMHPGTLFSLLSLFVIVGRIWIGQINMRSRQIAFAESQAKKLEDERAKSQKELADAVHHLRSKMHNYELKIALFEQKEESYNKERAAKEEGYATERRLLLENINMTKQMWVSREQEFRDLQKSEQNLRQRVRELERRLLNYEPKRREDFEQEPVHGTE